MNERIRELAEQAHSYACKYAQQPDYNEHNPYNQAMYKQRYDSKFAELIIDDVMNELFVVYPGGKRGSDVKFQNITARQWINQVFRVER